MKLTYTHESDFRRERDFGAKISATFEFIGAHFRPLLKCLTYFVLPPTLLFGIGIGVIFGSFGTIARMQQGQRTNAEFESLGITYFSSTGLVFLGATLSFLLMLGTVYGYVRVRMNTPATEPVLPGQVWAYMRARLGRIILSWLLFSALGVGVFAGVALLMFGTVGSLSGLGRSPDAGSIFSLFMIFMALMFVFTWLGIVLTQFFPILLLEDASIGTALRRSFYLIRGKWWSTFGLVFIASLIQSCISYVFFIPLYAIMFVQLLKVPGLDSPVYSVVAGSIYAIGAVFMYAIPLLAVMFQYFNLVERKEGTGLRQLVDSLGQKTTPEAHNSFYRPDEEGEY
jgi:hypothetical protein